MIKLRALTFSFALAVIGVSAASVAPALAGEAAPPAAATAQVGQPAPDFTLVDASGKKHTLSAYKGKVVVLEWTHPGCPFVVRHARAQTMKTLAAKHKQVVWLAINSTASNTAADSQKWAKEQGLPYPTLLDADGRVGKQYGARTTPHMFVIDQKGVLAYAGAIDDDARGKNPTPKNHVDAALLALAAGQRPSPAATEPYGCSVKYKQ